jgi:hypothetical protein
MKPRPDPRRGFDSCRGESRKLAVRFDPDVSMHDAGRDFLDGPRSRAGVAANQTPCLLRRTPGLDRDHARRLRDHRLAMRQRHHPWRVGLLEASSAVGTQVDAEPVLRRLPPSTRGWTRGARPQRRQTPAPERRSLVPTAGPCSEQSGIRDRWEPRTHLGGASLAFEGRLYSRLVGNGRGAC